MEMRLIILEKPHITGKYDSILIFDKRPFVRKYLLGSCLLNHKVQGLGHKEGHIQD
jgi:hypothetical protein